MPNSRNRRPTRKRHPARSHTSEQETPYHTHDIYRAEDRRGGIYGSSSQSDRTYDPNRFRSNEAMRALGRMHEDYDRDRDFSRTYSEDEDRYHRGSRDYGDRPFGVDSGFIKGAEYGGPGRGTDFGSFDRGDDLVFGSPWGRGASGYETGSERDIGTTSIAADPRHVRPVNFVGRGPRSYRRADQRVIEDICDALERHPGVDASEVEVDFKDGVATLRGFVEDRKQKRMAEDAAEEVPGVFDVINQLSLA